MNWRHLQAFLWLRWRLMLNQWRRSGSFNSTLMVVVAVGVLLLALPLFIGCLLVGKFALADAEPIHLLYAWDGLVVAFTFFWITGLITDLQRTDTLSLAKFLHLPVSVQGAFLINYLSSFLRLSLIIFMPALFGLGLGLILARGVWLLPVLPLTLMYLVMVTGVTYQFQGWLATLMNNPRRRRTVVAGATALFILMFQIPNLLNVYSPWGTERVVESELLEVQLSELQGRYEAQQFDAHEHLQRREELIHQHKIASEQADRQSFGRVESIARLLNVLLPIGWLPVGVMSAAEGKVLPLSLTGLGMTLIGSASLWRAYHTTIRSYCGQYSGTGIRKSPTKPSATSFPRKRDLLVEVRLPWLSESVSVIALTGLQSLLRAPESKMMLMTPLVLGGVFGAMLLKAPDRIPDAMRPLVGFSAMLVVVLGLLQLMTNQFGFDRDGFRALVLCAAPRRDVLLGKNLAFAPLAAGLAAITLIAIQVICPMRWSHLLAMLPQFVSMFLLTCSLTNVTSILTPMALSAGSLKPASPKWVPMLLQFVMIFFILPLVQAPLLLPWGTEAALEWSGWTEHIPICLLLSIAQCAVVVTIYLVVLTWQARQLQAREQRILEIITNRALSSV